MESSKREVIFLISSLILTAYFYITDFVYYGHLFVYFENITSPALGVEAMLGMFLMIIVLPLLYLFKIWDFLGWSYGTHSLQVKLFYYALCVVFFILFLIKIF